MKFINKSVGFLLIFIIIWVFCSSCNAKNQVLDSHIFDVADGEKLVEYDDGSYVISMGGPEYEHMLFDDYFVRVYDPLGIYFMPENKFPFLPEDTALYFVYSYSFSTDGYITAHIFQKTENSNTHIPVLIDGSESIFSEEYWFLLNTTSGKNEIFYDKTSYDKYCGENGIVFSSVYFYAPFQGGKEERIIVSEDVTIKRKAYYHTDTVMWKTQDVLFGQIKQYAVLPDFVVFEMNFDGIRFSAECPGSVNLSVPLGTEQGIVVLNAANGDTYFFSSLSDLLKAYPDWQPDWVSS